MKKSISPNGKRESNWPTKSILKFLPKLTLRTESLKLIKFSNGSLSPFTESLKPSTTGPTSKSKFLPEITDRTLEYEWGK